MNKEHMFLKLKYGEIPVYFLDIIAALSKKNIEVRISTKYKLDVPSRNLLIYYELQGTYSAYSLNKIPEAFVSKVQLLRFIEEM